MDELKQENERQLLDVLEDMIRKKREEIAGLNKLIGSIQHSGDAHDSFQEPEEKDTADADYEVKNNEP